MSDVDAGLSGTEAPRSGEDYPEWLDPAAALTAFQPPEGEALITSVAEAEVRRYGFRVNALGFLVAPGIHSEVVRAPTISAIPHSPSWLLGLINLRSNLVPVFDLHDLCGVGSASAKTNAMVLVLDEGERAVGILIDALPVPLLQPKLLPQLPPLPEVLRECVDVAYVAGSDAWLEFHHDRFFSSVIHKQ